MYVTPGLGIAPVIVVQTAAQLIDLVGKLFGGGIDAQRKAAVDQLIARAMANITKIKTPGTDPYTAYMSIRCLSGDNSAEVWNWYHTLNPDDPATACGCGTTACRKYCVQAATELNRRYLGLPATPAPTGVIPQVVIPVSGSDVRIFGMTPVTAGIVAIGAGVMLSSLFAPGRRRA